MAAVECEKKEFWDKIGEFFEITDWSQIDLAHSLAVSRSAVTRWVKRERYPAMEIRLEFEKLYKKYVEKKRRSK